jgi:hypothetical protein
MPLVDGVSWHPFYGTSPEHQRDYYYDYANRVQEIKDVAESSGFSGIYISEEIGGGTQTGPPPPGQPTYSPAVTPKYLGRVIFMNLGLDVIAGVGGTAGWGEAQWGEIRVLRNLSTIMAGAAPSPLIVEVETALPTVASYSFSASNSDRLLAIWNDEAAVDVDPGVASTLRFSGVSARRLVAIDVLSGFEQELVYEQDGGDIVVRDLLLKDYPLIVRLSP